MESSRRDKLQGVVLSLPTFNDDKFNLLLQRQKKHIQWLLDQGLKEGNAVFMIAGGLGEGYFLDDDEWRAMADVLVETTEGKVPTCIGVFELSARRAAKKARYAADVGIDFLQFAPPRYMRPSEEDVFGHFKYVNDEADVGILAYNTPWAMPGAGFEYHESILERFLDLENIVGIKWSSFDIQHYVAMLRLFADKFNFINNGGIMSVGPRFGMRGFIDFQANVAPRFSLHRWALWQQQKWDELDEIETRVKMDPFIKVVHPEAQNWVGMGEGPTSRLRLRSLGMESGPEFPAQAPLTQAYIDDYQRGVDASGIMDWVDWDQSIFDGIEEGQAAG